MSATNERSAFEAWYVENAFDLAASPIGSRDFALQWAAWQARTKELKPLLCGVRDALAACNVAGWPEKLDNVIDRASPSNPRTFTDSSGKTFTYDAACNCCHGMGRYVVGYSGRDDDGNALLWDDCDCFIPIEVGPPSRVLNASDAFCPKCGHNRDKSSVSSIDEGAGVRSCQMCGTKWRECIA